MRINHNIAALNTHRQFNGAVSTLGKAMEKLSSGQRISRAGDDAAGLAISEKMRAQIRGLEQSSRNAQDAISLLQTAEGGLEVVHDLLQRGRELSVQASNDTNTEDDRSAIQKEIDEITKEIDRIANDTEFNKKKLLNQSSVSPQDKEAVLENLKKGWLAASESLVSSALGIGGKNMDLKISLLDTIDGESNTAARVSYSHYGTPGPAASLELQIDMADFSPTSWPDGNGGMISQDRIIAHEMVHAAMAASVNVSTGMQTWFMEGVAEAVHGADERLSITLADMSTQSLVSRIGTGTSAWGGTSDDYSMAYAAVRYMDKLIADNGGAGVKDIISTMAADTTLTLNDAIAGNAALNAVGITSISTFASKFTSSGTGGGVEFIENDLRPNLSNGDTGSLIGSDRAASIGGSATSYTDSTIVDESAYGTVKDDPLSSYNEEWPEITITGSKLTMQVGANTDQSMQVTLADVKSGSLGIAQIDVESNPDGSIEAFDNAITLVSDYRSKFGAFQNRLEHAMQVSQNSVENLTSAESRIRDVDMAKEMMDQTKQSILSQAAQAMLAQANQQPQGVLQLLS